MPRLTLTLITAALSVALMGTFAGANPPPEHPAGIPSLSPESPRVGQPFTITFPDAIPPGHRVLSVSGFDRRLVESLDHSADDNALRWTAVIDRPGTFRLDALRTQLLDGSGESLRVDLPPVSVTVVSVLTTDEELDPSLAAELHQLLRQLPAGPLAAGAGVLLLLLLFAAHRWQNRPPPPLPPPTPPDDEALTALERLASEPPEDQHELHAAHGELAFILRRFLGRTLDLSVLDKTTTEVIDLLADELRANRVREPVTTILRACDRTRFAGQESSATALLDLIDDAQKLVRTLTEECTPSTEGQSDPHAGRAA